ncbi:MAG: glycoside hydrolase family 2 protein [Prevotella sp.]
MRHALRTFILTVMAALALPAVGQRQTTDISSGGWELTLDHNATWEGDTLYIAPELSALPPRTPSGGWSLLDRPDRRDISLPATVEGEMWGWNGQTFGVTGNYVGVSWWRKTVSIPKAWQGRRITLRFEAVRFRAEIFIDRRLAGYDIVNSTPFETDITRYVTPGTTAEIAVRITDPNGNFNWKDSQTYRWGRYMTNPSHGFGGITGRVCLQATPREYIEDIFIENTPDPHTVNAHITTSAPGSLSIDIMRHGEKESLWHTATDSRHVTVNMPQARLWDIDTPELYDMRVVMGGDTLTRRFGFRSFEVGERDGDRMFFLNGRRITLRTAISWSFWPDNGITPTKEMAIRQVKAAKALGLNMLNFHRTIGNTDVLDAADSLGLLYFEEPGGNQIPERVFPSYIKERGTAADGGEEVDASFAFKFRSEKLRRMIMRDRSHPSLVIYNMHNERGAKPRAEDREQMMMGHKLDPSRIMTYNSCNGKNPEMEPDDHFKLHLMPYEMEFRNTGWWDNHHAGGPGVYHDNIYQGPDNYLRMSGNKDEIVYWGEDGAIGTPPRLQLIRDEILASGRDRGWEAADYLAWYDAYDRFIRERGFSKAFPCVDSLTRKMGNVAYYYQGRVIENIRLNNTVDAYAINGWEAMKLENHSGMVDNYRNLKGDPELIAQYNKPLLVAVKADHKVLATGDTTTIDAFIINEKDIHGGMTLTLTATDSRGTVIGKAKRRVSVTGGHTYGERLMTGWKLRVLSEGYTHIKAVLSDHGRVIATGHEEIFAVEENVSLPKGVCAVADTTGVVERFMRGHGVETRTYTKGRPEADYMIVGAFEPTQFGSGYSDILEWVYTGHTLVIIDNTERWAELLADKEVMDYRGTRQLGRSWYGGNFFCRSHSVLDGLPADCVFNWEYQAFAAYNRRRMGMRDMNGDIIVACVSDHKKEVYSAMSEIRCGRGRVIITTLDIPSCLRANRQEMGPVDTDGMNESISSLSRHLYNKADITGRRLLLNLARYAAETSVRR